METLLDAPPLRCEPMGAAMTTWADLDSRTPPVTWLWPGWLPRGSVALVAADPGVGKSGLCLRLAMTVALGAPWPDDTPAEDSPGLVLWVETESSHCINLDRARRWGGQVFLERMVHPWEEPFTETRLDDPAHLARVQAQAVDPAVRLIVVDSLRGSHRGDENTGEVGALLHTLAQMAQQVQKPVLVTHHLRKRGTMEAHDVTLDRVRGSTSIVQFCRLVWAVDTPNPQAPDAKRLHVIKSNAGHIPPALGLQIDEDGVTFTSTAPSSVRSARKHGEAIAFLTEMLADGQHVPTTEILAAAEAAGIAESAIKRAKHSLAISAERMAGRWFWRLPPREER